MHPTQLHLPFRCLSNAWLGCKRPSCQYFQTIDHIAKLVCTLVGLTQSNNIVISRLFLHELLRRRSPRRHVSEIYLTDRFITPTTVPQGLPWHPWLPWCTTGAPASGCGPWALPCPPRVWESLAPRTSNLRSNMNHVCKPYIRLGGRSPASSNKISPPPLARHPQSCITSTCTCKTRGGCRGRPRTPSDRARSRPGRASSGTSTGTTGGGTRTGGPGARRATSGDGGSSPGRKNGE